MNRISIVQHYVDKIIDGIKSDTEHKNAIIHTYGVAQCCALIAGRRGLNTELAYISGLLHDIYAFFYRKLFMPCTKRCGDGSPGD